MPNMNSAASIRRSSALLIPLLVFALASIRPAFGGQCIVKEFYARPEIQSPPSVSINMNLDAPRDIGISVKAQQWHGGAGGSMASKLSAEELVEQRMFTTVSKDNLSELKALLPKDSGERNATIKKSGLLTRAISAGAVSIFDQIVSWDASALPTLMRGNSISMLDNALNGWSLEVQYRGRGDSVVGRERTYVELVKKLLASEFAKADAEGWGRLLAQVAYIPPSPYVIEIGKDFLTRGASVESLGAYGRTALTLAFERQNNALVLEMLKAPRISQNTLDEALAWSPLDGDEELLTALLDRGANINVDPSKFGRPSRYPAANAAAWFKFSGKRVPIALLIKHKVDPNRVSPSGRSALMFVIHDHELMKGLIELGANVNQRDVEGNTPLLLATRIPTTVLKRRNDTRPLDQIEPSLNADARRLSVEMLLQYGADPSIADNSGTTPLMQTTSADAQAIEMLAAKGGTVNAKVFTAFYNQRESSATGVVSAAVLNRNDVLASILLSRMDKLPADECGAVYYAAQTGAIKTLTALLSRKADVYAAKAPRGKTPLHVAAANGQLGAVKLLLDKRAAKINESTPFEVRNTGGHGPSIPYPAGRETALMLAVANGHTKIVEELLARGADVSLRDYGGNTARQYLRPGDAEIARLLQAR
jgi:ankyrin repeat protein